MIKSTKFSGQPIFCQVLSRIPVHIISQAVEKHNSDYYYKTLKTRDHLYFMLYGVITQCPSLRTLCKNLLFLENKLLYLDIKKLPAVSTLSDANINRSSEVFAEIYFNLVSYYKDVLSDSYLSGFINEEVNVVEVKIVDATTVSLWIDIFKAAGRKPLTGKEKGGLKIQTCMGLDSLVPEIVNLYPSARNDRNFLKNLQVSPHNIYVFDMGYINYTLYQEWSKNGVRFVTRLADNASYKVCESSIKEVIDYNNGGVIKEELISVQSNNMQNPLILRLITYKDPIKGKILKFVTNIMDCSALTIAALYKNRWTIEPLFKQIKQNFELSYFYSDSEEGIKTQIWIVLVANLIFEVLHKESKESEYFSVMVSMAATNMGSYLCLISMLKRQKLTTQERDIEIIQLSLFEKVKEGVVFETHKKTFNTS